MPLIGLVDPSHYERSHHKPGRLPRWYSVDEILAMAHEDNPKWAPWPFELVHAALKEHQERGDRISTSALTAPCPRGEIVKRKMDYIGTLDSMYLPVRGTMVHKMLEGYARLGSIAEIRFYTTVDGIEISCSPDLLTEKALYDYKVTDSPPLFDYPYRHHTEQVQFNAFIVRHAEKWETADGKHVDLPFDPREFPVEHAVVVYLGPKGPKVIETTRKQEFVTPTGVHKEAKRPFVWPDDEVLAELRPRIHAMHNAFEVFPNWPEGAEDVWGGEPSYHCPGPPLCNLPDCPARRYPDNLVWESDPEEEEKARAKRGR